MCRSSCHPGRQGPCRPALCARRVRHVKADASTSWESKTLSVGWMSSAMTSTPPPSFLQSSPRVLGQNMFCSSMQRAGLQVGWEAKERSKGGLENSAGTGCVAVGVPFSTAMLSLWASGGICSTGCAAVIGARTAEEGCLAAESLKTPPVLQSRSLRMSASPSPRALALAMAAVLNFSLASAPSRKASHAELAIRSRRFPVHLW